MGTLFVDKLDPQSGTSLEIGSSGDTITIPSGATITNNGTQTGFGGTNTPYFFASVTTNQSITHDVTTKASFDRADVDSASGFDTTNNRYTIPSGQGGYWHIGYSVAMDASGEYVKNNYIYPKKNGSDWPSFNSRHQGVASRRADSYPWRAGTMDKSFIATISAGEYIEIFVNYGDSRGGGNSVNIGEYYSCFWGYRLVQ